MVEKKEMYGVVKGKTYSLFGDDTSTNKYYDTIRSIVSGLLQTCPDQQKLLMHVQRAGGKRFKKKAVVEFNEILISEIKKKVRGKLPAYTKGVKEHLRKISITQRLGPVIRTKEKQYHLYMLEIELVNRIYREAFKQSEYKFALIPHCLRDFRPNCRSVPGDIEHICKGCTEDCYIHLGTRLLQKYDIHPYISVTMDLEKLFKKLKTGHPSIGALGIACIPELANGMRLCIDLEISPIGIPLNANRCARWMKQSQESSFDLKELKELLV